MLHLMAPPSSQNYPQIINLNSCEDEIHGIGSSDANSQFSD